MLIWICVDSQNGNSSKITKVIDAKYWALVNFDAGTVKEITFYDKREDFMDWVDFIIMKDKYESYMDFMNEGMMVLCVREEETIEEIMEAFTFKELDEVGF
jgi:predicted Fe-Mo cluster-binding NifX family protein